MKRWSFAALAILVLAIGAFAQQSVKPVQTTVSWSSTSLSADTTGPNRSISGYHQAIVTLKVTSADRTNNDETYDVYITTGDGVSSWDVIHFPQVASTGAKTYTAVVNGDLYPQTITTAGPGVVAVNTATLKTDTAGSDQGIRTLTAGMVRHGMLGDRLGYYVDVGGTSPGPFVFSITALLK